MLDVLLLLVAKWTVTRMWKSSPRKSISRAKPIPYWHQRKILHFAGVHDLQTRRQGSKVIEPWKNWSPDRQTWRKNNVMLLVSKGGYMHPTLVLSLGGYPTTGKNSNQPTKDRVLIWCLLANHELVMLPLLCDMCGYSAVQRPPHSVRYLVRSSP